MTALVVGSVALDSVATPFGSTQEALGGTATFFSLAAGLFTEVQMVGVVGTDFPESAIHLLESRRIDLAGLQRTPGETFRWVGRYDFNMNVAHTLETELNVFETFRPTIPDHYRDARLVFLGNIDPALQLDVLQQVSSPELIALDTMNFWIERKKDELTEVMRRADAIIINEAEIREYTGEYSVLRAARAMQRLGPRHVIIKRGEYGALMFSDDDIFLTPAFPTFDVRDTTGAGDSFAGGFVGYLDSRASLAVDDLRAALVYGTVMASFTVEGFSVDGLVTATPQDVSERFKRLADITHIEVPVHRPPPLIPEGV